MSFGGESNGGAPLSSDCVQSEGHAEGSADTSFGDDGIALLGVEQGLIVNGILTDDGGSLILAQNGTDCALFRLTADGQPDLSFGGSGRVDLGLEPSGYCWGLVVDAEGRVLVSGSEGNDGMVQRLDASGAPDMTFGEQGRARVDFGSLGDWLVDMVVQDDGSIAAFGMSSANEEMTGNWLAFFDENGVPPADPAGGAVELEPGPGRHLAVAMARGPDQHLLLLGYDQTESSAYWAEVDAHGAMVTSTGEGGWLRSAPNSYSSVRSLSTTSTGPTAWGYTSRYELVSFDATGRHSLVSNRIDGMGTSVATQCDGKLVVGGLMVPAGGVLQRLMPDGEIDASFETHQWESPPGAASEIKVVRIQPDTKIWAAGLDQGRAFVARYWP